MSFLLFLGLISANPIQVRVMGPAGPVSNQSIELFAFVEGRPEKTQTLKTNSQGIAVGRVPNLASTSAGARTLYQQVSYFSDLAVAPFNRPLEISVFPSSKDLSELRVKDLRLFFSILHGKLQVEQEIILENPTRKTMIGEKEKAATFQFSLPSSSFDLQFGMGFTEQETQVTGNDIQISSPLHPGTSRWTFTYGLEPTRAKVDFDQKVSAPILNLSLSTKPESLWTEGIDFVDGPRKWFENDWMSTRSVDGYLKSEISMRVGGLPWNIPSSMWLPFVVFFLLAVYSILFLKDAAVAPLSQDSRSAVLKELKFLEQSRRQEFMSERQYQLRRLAALEKLIEHNEPPKHQS